MKAVKRSFADELRNFAEKKVGIPVKDFKHNIHLISSIDKALCEDRLRKHCDEQGLKFDYEFVHSRLEQAVIFNDLYRICLQYIGTELYRMQVDNDIWAKSVGQTLDQDVITIIDDVRFPNELDVVKQSGVSMYSILLNSPPSLVELNAEAHASETSIGAMDFELHYYNFIDKNIDRLDVGKHVFNYAAPFYYMFKVMSEEPNKEKLLRETIKSTCI